MSNPNWDGERGGFDDIEYTIEESKFGFDERYDAAAGRSTPSWIIHGTAVLGDGQKFEASKQRYGIGKFDPVDGGARAVHESGDETKQFHYQTGYMNFVRAARACGAAEVLEARCQGDPMNLKNADVWVGLKFRLQRQVAGQRKDESGQMKDYSLLLPTEFLGEVGTGNAPSAPSSAAGSTPSSNGSTGLEALATEMKGGDKMSFLDKAVREKGFDIAEAEKAWDKVNA